MKPSIKFQHRAWNHICWSLDTKTGNNIIYNNGQIVSQAIVETTRTPIPGSPKHTKQFLILGQEPDKFLGGFDENQLLVGKLSRFNWWSKVLNSSTVDKMANCNLNIEGNVVAWKKESFKTNGGLRVYDLNPNEFCDISPRLFFFSGRRSRISAENLCGAHGGWVVTPKSAKENENILKIYSENEQECGTENRKTLGWIGVSHFKSKYFVTKFFKAVKDLVYLNYMVGSSGTSSPDNFTAMRSDGFWETRQEPLNTKLCTICEFDKTPVLYLKVGR